MVGAMRTRPGRAAVLRYRPGTAFDLGLALPELNRAHHAHYLIHTAILWSFSKTSGTIARRQSLMSTRK